MSRFEDAIGIILANEGGFVDDKCDPGGVTKYGISLRYLLHLGHDLGDLNHDGDVNAQDIIGLSEADACKLYRTQWWDAYHYSLIDNQAIATKVFDMAVNMGPAQAHILVQKAVNLATSAHIEVDGKFGNQTIAAINACNAALLLTSIRNQAESFYRSLVAKKPKLQKFLNGWIRRARS